MHPNEHQFSPRSSHTSTHKWQAITHLLSQMYGHCEYIYIGGMGSRRQVLSCEFEECSSRDIASLSYRDFVQAISPQMSGESDASIPSYVGLLGYDTTSSHTAPRIFKLKGEVCIDDGLNIVLKGEVSKKTHAFVEYYKNAFPVQKRKLSSALDNDEFVLVSEASKNDYLNTLKQVKNDIRSGRYYQLNLLRYFALQHRNEGAEDLWLRYEWIMRRFARFSEPMSAVISLHDETVVSFSPERFVRIFPVEDSYGIATYPIKGTVSRGSSEQEDQEAARVLQESLKDQAELNMIVDLMRNDLAQVCHRCSVEVLDGGSVCGFHSVYHRIAHIQGDLNACLTMQDMVRALLPAGSITGAPKKEVMAAIMEYERRERGYFMGNIFWLRSGGFLDSSVLIRTLHLQKDGKAAYAAGSGIVIGSVAEKEYEETQIKSRMWAD